MSVPEPPELPGDSPSDPASTDAQRASRLARVRHLEQQVAGVFAGQIPTSFGVSVDSSCCRHADFPGDTPDHPLARSRRAGMGDGMGDGVGRVDAARWVSSGCPSLDRRLPGGLGFRRGSLVEWFASGPGSGAGTLALLVARHACAAGGTLVVLDPAARFYPPAAAACGIDLRRLLVIRPQRARDALWAWDQALRCPAVKAVWGWLEALDDRWFRRFQLAAEQSGCLGLLLRSVRYRGDPSWSGVQLAVSAGGESRSATDWTRRGDSESSPAPLAGRCLRVEVVRWRGSVPPRSGSAEGMAGTTLRLEERCGHLEVIEVEAIEASCHETPALHLVSELADPTPPGRATGT